MASARNTRPMYIATVQYTCLSFSSAVIAHITQFHLLALISSLQLNAANLLRLHALGCSFVVLFLSNKWYSHKSCSSLFPVFSFLLALPFPSPTVRLQFPGHSPALCKAELCLSNNISAVATIAYTSQQMGAGAVVSRVLASKIESSSPLLQLWDYLARFLVDSRGLLPCLNGTNSSEYCDPRPTASHFVLMDPGCCGWPQLL